MLLEQRSIAGAAPGRMQHDQVERRRVGGAVIGRVRNELEVGQLAGAQLVHDLAGLGVAVVVALASPASGRARPARRGRSPDRPWRSAARRSGCRGRTGRRTRARRRPARTPGGRCRGSAAAARRCPPPTGDRSGRTPRWRCGSSARASATRSSRRDTAELRVVARCNASGPAHVWLPSKISISAQACQFWPGSRITSKRDAAVGIHRLRGRRGARGSSAHV